MNFSLSRFTASFRTRGVPQRVSSLLMLLQRSPLISLLPEARVISTSGFSSVLAWTVTAITGLGAFDSVSGASTVSQASPSPNSTVVNGTGGQSLVFIFSFGGTDIPDHFEVLGTLPPGLTQNRLTLSKQDFITGVPRASGNFPITIKAWRDAAQALDSTSTNFTLVLAAPPLPSISVQPAGANSTTGGMVSMFATQTSGYDFTWKKGGTPLPSGETLLVSKTTPRKWITPASDPGVGWRNGTAFVDTAWTAVSGGIGYDNSPSPVNYAPLIAQGGTVATGKVSALVRIPFTLSSHAALSFLKFRFQCDDGYVAWLNGTEIGSLNKPAGLAWNSAASNTSDDNVAITLREIDITPQLGLLRAGENLLAVQALNTASSSDFLFNCELAAGINTLNSPRLILSGIQPSDAGDYTLTVTNTTGSATSNPAALILPPAIDTQPVSLSIGSGATAQLNVTASISPPFTYQWYRGASGDTSDPVDGAKEASFTTPPLTAAATFWVRVTNAAGHIDSSAATVTVTTSDPFTVWKTARFSAAEAANTGISGPAADPDQDGLTNEQEYIFGTLPTGLDAPVAPSIGFVNGSPLLSFIAHAATGEGYSGRSRVYTVESAGSAEDLLWTPLPGFTDIAGNDQTVTVPLPSGSPRSFFRLRVRLTP